MTRETEMKKPDPKILAALRERSGKPLLVCHRALRESDGCLEDALHILGVPSAAAEAEERARRHEIAKDAALRARGALMQPEDVLLWHCTDPAISFYGGPTKLPATIHPRDLNKTTALAEQWSPQITYEAKFPRDGTRRSKRRPLKDCLACHPHALSKRLREFLEAGDFLGGFELLPITLEPGAVLTAEPEQLAEYSLMHPVELVPCIDVAASDVTWFSAREWGQIVGAERLIIDESRLPADRHIFCPKYWPSLILIRKPLARRLLEEGFSGMDFGVPSTYMGIGFASRLFTLDEAHSSSQRR
ncbi:MAG: hypothetical protein JRH20_20300 [Deltaproteobacteria bacterium]|nr:hypothetical protein [Deltaproteobacteria bacterium]